MFDEVKKTIQKVNWARREYPSKALTRLDALRPSVDSLPQEFALIDAERYQNDAASFVAFVELSLQTLREKGYAAGLKRYRLEKRILQNLGIMIASAIQMQSRFVPLEQVADRHWKNLAELLKQIPDNVLMQTEMSRYTRVFLLDLKYGHTYTVKEQEQSCSLCFENCDTYPIGSYVVQLDGMQLTETALILDGYYRMPAALTAENPRLTMFCDDEPISFTPVERYTDKYLFGRLFSANQGFHLELPLSGFSASLSFGISHAGKIDKCTNIAYHNLCPIDKDLKQNYYYHAGYILEGNGRKITVSPCDDASRKEQEEAFCKEIREVCPDRADAIIHLRTYAQSQEANAKPKWLILDRADRADDNGEVFFRYLCAQHKSEVDPVFVLSKESPDFQALSQVGEVLDFHSTEHLEAFLTADYILSSQMAPSTRNPFNEDFRFFRDLVHDRRFIFLQHGLTHNDNGYAFSHFVRDFYGIITSARAETDYLRSPEFFNAPENIWETGMPRFDALYSDDQRIITIMPTWRKYLTNREFDPEKNTKVWTVSERFPESSYFRFYYGLIHDARLIEAARNNHYRIQFMLHVQFQSMGELFDSPDPEIVQICTPDTKYRDVFARSSMLVSDYSSILFDFAYLRKPVLYCQFDKAAFFASHTVKPGYFDFDRDGFGEVTGNLEDTVTLLIQYMEHDCALKEQYRRRMDAFFAYADQGSCKRIYDMLQSHSAERQISAPAEDANNR